MLFVTPGHLLIYNIVRNENHCPQLRCYVPLPLRFFFPDTKWKRLQKKKGVDLQRAKVIVFSEQVASVRNPPIGALGIDQEPRLSNPSRIIYNLLFSRGGTSNILTEGNSSPKQLVLEVGREISKLLKSFVQKVWKDMSIIPLSCKKHETWWRTHAIIMWVAETCNLSPW